MKRNIVIINQDSGYLIVDIANAFVSRNWQCTLVAGRLVRRNNPLDDQVKFKKIIRYDRRSSFKRLLTWSVASVQILFLILFKYRGSYLLIVSNPPFAPLLSLFSRNKFSLLIFDIYPDTLTEMGIFSKKSLLVQLWKRWNRKIFTKADRIFTITSGMKNVLQQYTGNKDVQVVPIWTDSSFLKPIEKKINPFVIEHELLDKFVVLYSGNLGYTHDIESIIELATIVDNPNVLFLIIGDGDKKKVIQDKIQQYGLKNCKMLPFQSPTDLPYSLSSADLAIVTLGSSASRLSVPSKTYNLMSVGAALLCIAEKGSELASLVEKFDIGKCLPSDRLEEMKFFIDDLIAKPEQLIKYKKNSHAASLQFSPENASKFIPTM